MDSASSIHGADLGRKCTVQVAEDDLWQGTDLDAGQVWAGACPQSRPAFAAAASPCSSIEDCNGQFSRDSLHYAQVLVKLHSLHPEDVPNIAALAQLGHQLPRRSTAGWHVSRLSARRGCIELQLDLLRTGPMRGTNNQWPTGQGATGGAGGSGVGVRSQGAGATTSSNAHQAAEEVLGLPACSLLTMLQQLGQDQGAGLPTPPLGSTATVQVASGAPLLLVWSPEKQAWQVAQAPAPEDAGMAGSCTATCALGLQPPVLPLSPADMQTLQAGCHQSVSALGRSQLQGWLAGGRPQQAAAVTAGAYRGGPDGSSVQLQVELHASGLDAQTMQHLLQPAAADVAFADPGPHSPQSTLSGDCGSGAGLQLPGGLQVQAMLRGRPLGVKLLQAMPCGTAGCAVLRLELKLLSPVQAEAPGMVMVRLLHGVRAMGCAQALLLLPHQKHLLPELRQLGGQRVSSSGGAPTGSSSSAVEDGAGAAASESAACAVCHAGSEHGALLAELASFLEWSAEAQGAASGFSLASSSSLGTAHRGRRPSTAAAAAAACGDLLSSNNIGLSVAAAAWPRQSAGGQGPDSEEIEALGALYDASLHASLHSKEHAELMRKAGVSLLRHSVALNWRALAGDLLLALTGPCLALPPPPPAHPLAGLLLAARTRHHARMSASGSGPAVGASGLTAALLQQHNTSTVAASGAAGQGQGQWHMLQADWGDQAPVAAVRRAQQQQQFGSAPPLPSSESSNIGGDGVPALDSPGGSSESRGSRKSPAASQGPKAACLAAALECDPGAAAGAQAAAVAQLSAPAAAVAGCSPLPRATPNDASAAGARAAPACSSSLSSRQNSPKAQARAPNTGGDAELPRLVPASHFSERSSGGVPRRSSGGASSSSSRASCSAGASRDALMSCKGGGTVAAAGGPPAWDLPAGKGRRRAAWAAVFRGRFKGDAVHELRYQLDAAVTCLPLVMKWTFTSLVIIPVVVTREFAGGCGLWALLFMFVFSLADIVFMIWLKCWQPSARASTKLHGASGCSSSSIGGASTSAADGPGAGAGAGQGQGLQLLRAMQWHTHCASLFRVIAHILMQIWFPNMRVIAISVPAGLDFQTELFAAVACVQASAAVTFVKRLLTACVHYRSFIITGLAPVHALLRTTLVHGLSVVVALCMHAYLRTSFLARCGFPAQGPGPEHAINRPTDTVYCTDTTANAATGAAYAASFVTGHGQAVRKRAPRAPLH